MNAEQLEKGIDLTKKINEAKELKGKLDNIKHNVDEYGERLGLTASIHSAVVSNEMAKDIMLQVVDWIDIEIQELETQFKNL